MASIARDKNGNRRIQFVAPNGKRPTIRLGKVSQRSAEAVKYRVEQLLAAKLTGHAVDADTARWVAQLKPKMADKLVRVGLISKRSDTGDVTLAEHVAGYISKRTDVKPATLTHWRQAQRSLLTYFGEDRPLGSITAGDARDWERWLRTPAARMIRHAKRTTNEGLSPNTARKRVSDAKQFLQDAVDRDLLIKNPFSALKGSVGSNRDRDFFVTREMAEKVLDACPDAEWRLIFALSRFAGLRCPSEHLALRWGDVHWDTNRFVVRSAKTDHHEGKGARVVPIFPELRPHLELVWDEAASGTEFVITRYRSSNSNLRTQLQRIVRAAGLEAWPKLFQNLRASRATELAAEHPAHVAANWLGHSTTIAQKHYWQVTDDDFAKATMGVVDTDEVAQNAAQQAHAMGRNDSQLDCDKEVELPMLLADATSCDSSPNSRVGDTGLEPVTPSLSS